MNKESYMNIMEKVLESYPVGQIEARTWRNMKGRMDLQSYSRIACVLAALIAGNRKPEWEPLWIRMMTECCEEIHQMNTDVAADFSMKEIMLAIKFMEKRISPSLRKLWLGELKKADPSRNYAIVIRNEEDAAHIHNINVYNMTGEYMREAAGIAESEDYFARHWPVQLKRFDENGMYRDPGCPLLYDLTTRCHIQLILAMGYRGAFFGRLDGFLRKAGVLTLYMQSAASEFAYGGRSSQFLFNEALLAVNGEYEASRYKREGNMALAGAFKRSARLAIQSIGRWLEDTPSRHMKNFYPSDSGYGTEEYAYFDKYMITTGAFLAIACLLEDDTIPEQSCPADKGGYVFRTSGSFHKIMAAAGPYSIQIDTKGDQQYDSTGIGRIHKRGVPTELGLSTPFVAHPKYRINAGSNPAAASLCPGWREPDGQIRYLAELKEGLEHQLRVIKETEDEVCFELVYHGEAFHGCKGIKETYTLNEEGLYIQSELIEPSPDSCMMYYRIPLLTFNGCETTEPHCLGKMATVMMGDHTYAVAASSELMLESSLYENRNGAYRTASVQSPGNSISVHLSLH